MPVPSTWTTVPPRSRNAPARPSTAAHVSGCDQSRNQSPKRPTLTGRGIVAGTAGILMASHQSPRSPAEAAIGPGQSSDGASGIIPSAGSRPWVGLSPQHPQREAGIRMEPPVSVPSASGTTRVVTAAPDPPLEPPVIRPGSHGFRVGPHAE
jgi:hypothetical protein